jgi:signal transduction histidine kinase/nucleotide-binding universal stress UspA family protein
MSHPTSTLGDSVSPVNSSLFGQHPDSILDSRLIEKTLGKGEHLARWMGWRLRLLAVAALLGCLAVVMVVRWLAASPQLAAEWRLNTRGGVELVSTTSGLLKPFVGQTLVSLHADGVRIQSIEPLALAPSTRWLTDDNERIRQQQLHTRIADAMARPRVTLKFSGGATVELSPQPRKAATLGPVFWLLFGLALGVYLVAMVVLMARPALRTLLYAVMAVALAGNLAFMAIESTLTLGLPWPIPMLDLSCRVAFDLIIGAAALHAACVHPRRLPGGVVIAWAGWTSMSLLGLLMAIGWLDNVWWWTQAAVALTGAITIGLFSWSHRLLQHPFSLVMRRFSLISLGTWILVTATVSLSSVDHVSTFQQHVAGIGLTVWYVFFASLLLLIPFLSNSQQVMREFSLLAGISTVATSLDLLFVTVFSFGQFASVTLALFVSLGLYAGARQWILNRVRSRNMLTTERMFEKLYRIAREVEAHPERSPTLLNQLLQDLFEPMESIVVHKRSQSVRVVSDGSTMLVPVPALTDKQLSVPSSVVMRFAYRGQRLFTSEDARLTERIVEQLCRAVAFDRAVEQGRSEERLRLAQDLHDDIGARLLTLMYKAPSTEMEDYVRHTLQDLKTLTRGLAAHNRPLSHAAGEWKADITQRLTAAHIELDWSLTFDQDVNLSVVQWSGLTRVMRELVSNVIAHSGAHRLEIDFQLERDRIDLTFTDNGTGRNPKAWAHGLGLGGVRKRVKQLGGEVEWREVSPAGIRCRVCVRQLSEKL